MHQYLVITQNVVGDQERGYEIAYGCDGKKFDDRQSAISHGFKIGRSDDFNVGVLTHGKLTSFDWMEEPVDEEPQLLAEIARQIGI